MPTLAKPEGSGNIRIAKARAIAHVRRSTCRAAVKKSSIPHVTVGQLYTNHASQLQLKLLAGAGGLQRRITEGAVNRPGLALAGFYRSFAFQRVQIIGSGETQYLKSLPENTRRQIIKNIQQMPQEKVDPIIHAMQVSKYAFSQELSELS